jgi:hypothetical protein
MTDGASEESKVEAPEVFLGGSCNPTTWRADVAMPELDKLGISFYNPVSCLSPHVADVSLTLILFFQFAASLTMDA